MRCPIRMGDGQCVWAAGHGVPVGPLIHDIRDADGHEVVGYDENDGVHVVRTGPWQFVAYDRSGRRGPAARSHRLALNNYLKRKA